MTKTQPVGVRLDPEVKAALELLAKEDHRSLSSLITKIISEWMLQKDAPIENKRTGRRG